MTDASVRILCVEDETDLLRDIGGELEEAGYQPMLATNGQDALDVMQQCRPDLILCDISMPGMDGYELMQKVHEQGSGFVDIPFVFLSAYSDPQQVIKGKELGADDYLVKPIDYDLLLATVKARLRQVERIQAASEPNMDALSARYQLTQSEAKLAKALVNGLQLDEIARQFNVSRSTVVTHLRHIFVKTDTSRQAELVALLLRPSTKA